MRMGARLGTRGRFTSTLIAFCSILGNSQFRCIYNRASLKVSGKSIQEALDLNIALLMSERGVKLIDRGRKCGTFNENHLLKYKQKFGPITEVEEVDYYGVTLR